MKTVIVCILLAFAIASASAACFHQPPIIVQYKWAYKLAFYCEYNGRKYMSGSNFTDVDSCQKCSCTLTGLSCCGIGYYAGFEIVPGCEVVPDHCEAAILNSKKTALCHQ